MSSFESQNSRGEKLFKKPEFIKPPPSDKQKMLTPSTKKIEHITEIVDLERESLIRKIEKLIRKANVVELILNYGSLTGKIVLKNGIIIDVFIDEYTDIEAIIYLLQITEEDILRYLPMFLKKKLEEENLLDTLEAMIKYRPEDMQLEIEMEEKLEEKKRETNIKAEQKIEHSSTIDDLDKEIEALLLEIDSPKKEKDIQKEVVEEKLKPDIQKEEVIKEEIVSENLELNELLETIEYIENIAEEKSEKNTFINIEEKEISEDLAKETQEKITSEPEETLEVTEISSKVEENFLEIEEEISTEDSMEKPSEPAIEANKNIIETKEEQEELGNQNQPENEKIEEIEEDKYGTEERKIVQKEVFKEKEITRFENILNIEKEKQVETKLHKKEIKREEPQIMIIDNLVNKLSSIPPIEEFHLINTDTEEVEYSSNNSLDEFSLSTLIATYKDLSLFSSFSQNPIKDIIIDTDEFYYIITNIDEARILVSKCSKKSNPSLISSLIIKAIKK